MNEIEFNSIELQLAMRLHCGRGVIQLEGDPAECDLRIDPLLHFRPEVRSNPSAFHRNLIGNNPLHPLQIDKANISNNRTSQQVALWTKSTGCHDYKDPTINAVVSSST